jgi:hypothetical protein
VKGPKERRLGKAFRKDISKLFKNGKPLVRRMEILDGDTYSSDMGVLWAAYKAKSFGLPEGLKQEDFVKAIEQQFSNFGQVWIVDDKNKSFSKGSGPVGLVLTSNMELLVEAKFGFFKWATKRNVLKSAAAFLNMIKSSTKTGICMVRTEKDKRVLPDHLKSYGLLFYAGRVSANEYLYSVIGRGSD